MNLVESGSSPSSSSIVVIGLAVLGIALGGIGTYVAFTGRSAVRDYDSRISELEQRVQRIAGATEELNGQIRGLHHNTKTALQSVGEQLTALRQEIQQARQAQQARPSPPTETQTASPGTATAPASGKTYTIRAGDILAKVAREHGTTVDAILKANPGINPNRIKVGQVINLP